MYLRAQRLGVRLSIVTIITIIYNNIRSRPHKSRSRICGYDFVVPTGGRRNIVVRYCTDKIVLFVQRERATTRRLKSVGRDSFLLALAGSIRVCTSPPFYGINRNKYLNLFVTRGTRVPKIRKSRYYCEFVFRTTRPHLRLSPQTLADNSDDYLPYRARI